MTTCTDTPQQDQQPVVFSTTTPSHTDVLKSSNTSQTAATVVESSEEFTLSGEMTASSCGAEPEQLQLSNMVILEETTAGRPRKVTFANELTIIKEEDIYVPPPAPARKSRKDRIKQQQQQNGGDMDASLQDQPIAPSEIWWTQEELQNIELNASYLVKESQQYQEEVIVAVLYNKAFLSASNLGKSISEEQVYEKLQDVTQFSHTLEKWTAVGHSRRGLENMVSDKAIADAIQSRMVVLHFQKELKESSNSDADGEPSTMAQHAEFLAKRCQDTSRTSRVLARMMGQADADSLQTAEELCAEEPRLPEPPGRYSGDRGELDHMMNDCSLQSNGSNGRVSRRNRRGSLLKSVKKTVGNVFRRKDSQEVNMKRIRKIQLRRQQELEAHAPPKRPSQEFRRSFLDSLDYGEQ